MIPPAVLSPLARKEALRQARIAAFKGDHKEASMLYAMIDVPYIVEVQVWEARAK